MHGFALVDDAGRPRSPYVGWKTSARREPIGGIDSVTLVTRALGDRFRTITGMRPRPGPSPHEPRPPAPRDAAPRRAPRRVAARLARARGCGDATGLGAPDDARRHGALRRRDGAGLGRAPGARAGADGPHGSPGRGGGRGERRGGHLAPPRARDPAPRRRRRSPDDAPRRGRDRPRLRLAEPRHRLPARGPRPRAADAAVERRPYFDGGMLHAITHIPGGRALATFVGFLEDAARAGGAPPRTSGESLPASAPTTWPRPRLDVDLAVFQGAWGYRDGGRLGRIEDGTLTVRNYLASVLRAFVAQYAALVPRLDPGRGARPHRAERRARAPAARAARAPRGGDRLRRHAADRGRRVPARAARARAGRERPGPDGRRRAAPPSRVDRVPAPSAAPDRRRRPAGYAADARGHPREEALEPREVVGRAAPRR